MKELYSSFFIRIYKINVIDMKARFINEKFVEDSDPIKDMGIGLPPPKLSIEDKVNLFREYINEQLPDEKELIIYRIGRYRVGWNYSNDTMFAEISYYGLPKMELRQIESPSDKLSYYYVENDEQCLNYGDLVPW